MCACVHGLSLACLVLFSFASSSSSSLFTFEYLFMCCVRQSMSACLLSISFRFRSNRIRLIEFLCLRFSAFYITSISYHFYFLLTTQNYKKNITRGVWICFHWWHGTNTNFMGISQQKTATLQQQVLSILKKRTLTLDIIASKSILRSGLAKGEITSLNGARLHTATER